jgi:hypothetical protein
MMVFVGTAFVGFMMSDIEREHHVLRSGLDLTWQIDEEIVLTPTPQDETDFGSSLSVISEIDNPTQYLFISSIFHGDSSSVASLKWRIDSGELAASSRASLSGDSVIYDGKLYTLRDDEKLVVFEYFKLGRGMAASGVHYAGGIVYKEDLNIGP